MLVDDPSDLARREGIGRLESARALKRASTVTIGQMEPRRNLPGAVPWWRLKAVAKANSEP
jgi:hypothetical protein